MKAGTKRDMATFRRLLQKAEGIKERVAAERDSMRTLLEEIESLWNKWEIAEEDMGAGIRLIKDAIESISEDV